MQMLISVPNFIHAIQVVKSNCKA